MCGLKAEQICGQPFRAAKELMQPLASQNLFLYSGKKNYILVFNKICALVSFVDSGHKLLSQTMATNRLYITPRMLCSSSAKSHPWVSTPTIQKVY